MSEDTVFDPSMPCPCGSGRTYGECCKPAHDGIQWPQTADALVRARYAAYVTKNYDFLVASAHKREEFSAENLAKSCEGVSWIRLHIVSFGSSTVIDSVPTDIVDYYAYYQVDGNTIQLGERAYFQRVEDKIYYVDGEELHRSPFHREQPKVGRNDPCPCGSGKKYKKCCGRNQQ